MKINDFFYEEKTRLDPACWTGKKIGTPKTKVKGGVRVNNCVPAESVAEDAVTDFVTRGGQIQQGKLHKPRKGETWQGSSHIGAAGGTGTKGTVSGKAANTNPKSGKPVVTAEQWEPVKKEQGVAEGSGDKKPYPNTWHDVDPKLGKQVDKMSPEEKVKKGYANPSILKKNKQQAVAEGSLNELSSDLLKRSAQAATDKRNQAMDPELHNALGGGYMNPLATHYDNVSQKMDNRAAQVRKKETIQKIASKIASPAVMRKIGMAEQGVAEGFNGEYDDEAGMADNNLETLRRAVDGIDNVINTGDNLPEWCQEKIAVAKSMLVTVWDYMRSEEQIEDPEIAEMYEAMQLMAESMAHKHRVSVDLVWESFEALDDHMLYETAAWRRKEGKSAKGGLNANGVASYRRENPGSKLQTAVTTKPSKLKPGSKAAKRRKSFCARMSGVKGPAKKPNGKPTRKTLALRKWNC